jgi:hypothetical protein
MENVVVSGLQNVRAARDTLERQLETDRAVTARLLAEGWETLARGWRLLADPIFRQAFVPWPSPLPPYEFRPEPIGLRTPRPAWSEWSSLPGGLET